MDNNLFFKSKCLACDLEYIFELRKVGTARTKKIIPLLCCLNCHTLTCISDYKESNEQLKCDVDYNCNIDIVNNKIIEFDLLIKMLKLYIPNLQKKIIGELGSNIGVFLESCRLNSIKAIGYEINPFAIEKKLFPNIDLRNKFYGSDSIMFDVSIAIDVFEHLKEPRKVLQDMIDHLNIKGYIYITVPRIDKSLWHYLNTSCEEMMHFDMSNPFRDNDVHIIHFSILAFKQLIISLGLKLIKDFVDENDLNRNWPMNGVLFQKV